MGKKQLVKEIFCEIVGETTKTGPMAHFKEYEFIDMINWVWRNCQGCIKIEIIPDIKVIVAFEDRIEVYTLKEVEIN